ncbi:BspA family leucine-rich repeat surface protein [Candidatus Saccharibacteria bacterium]|nr:BspA family leucine-rich repeat surface protein [Candidatus Saccharibacteria bacterium]
MRITKKLSYLVFGLPVVLSSILAIATYVLFKPDQADALTAADPSTIPACAHNPECFAFSIDTTLDSDGDHTNTSTTFAIPTSGLVSANFDEAGYNSYRLTCLAADPNLSSTTCNDMASFFTLNSLSYDWTINWGDSTGDQTVTGTSNANGIPHTYTLPGQYQITIRPSTTATDGWFNAFGFYYNAPGANDDANKAMFRSIDTPFTNLMRTKGSDDRFAGIFLGAVNGTEIPANLFANISTVGDTNFNDMFYGTFQNYAYNSTTATIPAGLFNSLNTSSGTNFGGMFMDTFTYYAYNSTTATIPAGLFSNLNTSSGTSFYTMFYYTFAYYADNSTTDTIPAGLFNSLNTSNGTYFSFMFGDTFNNYAPNSTTATIPTGLFSGINTSKGVSFDGMFGYTFYRYAVFSTVGTIPTDLFDNIDTSNGHSLSLMFDSTFSAYAVRTATFKDNSSVVDVQSLRPLYSLKSTSTGVISSGFSPTPGDIIVPTYDNNDRTITAPTGTDANGTAYADYDWYRTDGTSCSVAHPTPDCGIQNTSTLVTFPNSTEWTPTTSTEHGSVTFYTKAKSEPPTEPITPGVPGVPDTGINTTKYSLATPSILLGASVATIVAGLILLKRKIFNR